MVGVSAVVLSPSGAAPSGLPRFARLDPGSLRKPKFRCAPFSLSSLAASLRSAKCHLVPRCHRSLPLACRGYFRSFLAPITHVNLRSRFASTSLSLGRILPRSSVGLASLALGTIGLILRHDCVCACDFFSKFLNFFLRLGDRHFIFEIAWNCPGYARVLSE
jgi:hypothetical protein